MYLQWLYCVTFIIVTAPPIFTSPMYNLVHEHVELLWYNDSMCNDVKVNFGKISRTASAFNCSFNVIQDIPEGILIGIYVDKMFGTEFKRTGTMFTVNGCKFWKKDMFGINSQLNKNGHMTACDLKKGRYWTTNFIPNIELFPKYLPYGSYKIDIQAFHVDKSKFMHLYWFSRVEPLVKW